MITSELKDKILRDILAANAPSISLHPDYFSDLYDIDREKYIEILDEFFYTGLIIPDQNNTHNVDWLVEITPKAHAFISSGGFSSAQPYKKGIPKLKIPDFDTFNLCEYRTKPLSVKVWAEIEEGCLRLSGVDTGSLVEDRFCDNDHEYWYTFDAENTKRLLSILSSQTQERDVKKLLSENLGDLDGYNKMHTLCKVFEIEYYFFSF